MATNDDRAATRILLIDDNADASSALVKLLSVLGASVTGTADAKQAANLVQQIRPDIVLLDLLMPGKDGFTVAKNLRMLDDWHAFRMIALTGLASTHAQADCKEAGFDGCLIKPVELFTFKELLD